MKIDWQRFETFYYEKASNSFHKNDNKHKLNFSVASCGNMFRKVDPSSTLCKNLLCLTTLVIVVQSFYGKKSVNLPLIATEGFSTVLDSAIYPY